MDSQGPDKSKIKPRNSKAPAIAVVVLTAAAGGAYFFYVDQPQMKLETIVAALPFLNEPLSVSVKPVSKPANTKEIINKPTTSAVPTTVSPSASPDKQPAIAHTSSLVQPTLEKTAESAKPKPVAQKNKLKKSKVVKKHKQVARKYKPKKRKAASKSKYVAKPEQTDKSVQAAEIDNKSDLPAASQQVTSQAQAERPVPAYSTIKPLLKPAPVESVSIALAEPALVRRVITPKYSDVMTPVLRGDRVAVKQLLDLGWWVDKPSTRGITPLMAAVMNQDTQMAQLLLDYGAKPSVEALKLARKNKDDAMVSLLEQKGSH